MNTINKLCFEIIHSGSDLNRCINGLEELKKYIKEAKNKRTLIKYASEDFNRLMVYEIFYCNDKGDDKIEQIKYFKYIEEDKSIGAYAGMLMAQVVKDNKISSFNMMIDTVLGHLKTYKSDTVNCGDLITKEMVRCILELPLVKNTGSLLAENFPILILNIDYTCEFNSSSLPYLGVIVNSRSNLLNGDKNYPDYVFMHELGHLFNVYVSGIEVPESFGDVIKNAFGKDISNIPKETLKEVFADCFAIACAYGTQFEKTNPFIQMFRREDSRYITNYIKELIEEKMDN